MKVVILAGGFGTRISEESQSKPKPMIEIGGKPILWHIMRIYSHYGFNEFIICLGYKSHVIMDYFANYDRNHSTVTYHLAGGDTFVHDRTTEPWKVTLVDTGLDTMTGGRIKRIAPYVGNEPFMLTYGDGLASIDINELLDFHKKQGKLATVTAVQPDGRFGALQISEDHLVQRFFEKPKGDDNWVNGGFFVLQPEVFSYLEGDDTVFEKDPLEKLAKDGQLAAYRFDGFWQPMDTLRDKNMLEQIWNKGSAPWKK
ncbi:glucose-1-phosphate cytidylyltransferase [Paenibacillus protaetiae]|uniref:Glucose-1-phosphate cytidylyltransferase n=1 Tax=Paenibacillus protaetiae TaxID=2509456 RepID=A0A4P6EWT3_9BACL|nr:glucose-1-phosphate cytidylyltransferase [Paenibacillus protaetiae]QAY65047.1 glucose-1-phosphate cytidylyltransferase [Paenibacillus protaetiae]